MATRRLKIKDAQREAQHFLRRNLLIGIIIIVMVVALIMRLFLLQVIEHDKYTTLSHQNQLYVTPIEPNRGLIYDRNGILLAENLPVYNLEVTLERVSDLPKLLKSLRELITISDEDVERFHKLRKQRRRFEPTQLKINLSEQEVAKFSVNRYRFPGANVKARLMRHYTDGPLMSHVIGFVGRINLQELRRIDTSNYAASQYIGKVGIERFYEGALHGRVGYERVETDASGRTVRVLSRTMPLAGNNVYLTIDSRLQKAAYEALGKTRGSIVAIDPNNGEILAMVSNPPYEPNRFIHGITSKEYKSLQDDPQQPLFNRSIRGRYPFGSTIKPFYGLQGLKLGTVTPKFRVFDPGTYQIPGNKHIFRCWKWASGGHRHVNLRKAIVVSCDTYFYELAYRLGIRRLADILFQFGFGKKTGIDMREELPALVATPEWKRAARGRSWYTGDTINAGIGQGYMLTTPLQLASGTAALAMRGKRYTPHLLHHQVLPNGMEVPYEHKVLPSVDVKDPTAWDLVIDAMHRVITEGTARAFGTSTHYKAAAKTGTAQVYSAKRHTHLNKRALPEFLRDHSLFIVFAPIKHPKIAVAVIAENDKSKAKRAARKVVDFYLVGPPKKDKKSDKASADEANENPQGVVR